MSTSDAWPGFVEHDRVRIVEVAGSDARRWLNDLVTGPIGSLGQARATRSLLLTPTGRIRADFTVVDPGNGAPLTVLQDIRQQEAVDALLSPYVLSSDVELSDAGDRLVLFSLPGADTAPDLPERARSFRPSAVGPGIGILVERSASSSVAAALSAVTEVATGETLERFRIESRIPLYGIDFDAGALPAEAGLEEAIDFTKGCFLGQESVARVRNLGHPPTVLVALHAPTTVASGERVYAGETDVGSVTSVATVPDDGTLLFARVRWDARTADLRTETDAPLSRRSVNEIQT